MTHRSHKIAGPLLRSKPTATPERMEDAFTTPVGLRAPRCIVDEWVNEARKRNGRKSTSAIAGEIFRAQQELRKRGKQMAPPVVKLSLPQRIARRISRLFRKH